MVLRTQKNKNNNIQTQLKTIPTEKQSFPGGNNNEFEKTVHTLIWMAQLPPTSQRDSILQSQIYRLLYSGISWYGIRVL